jgi:uncharacterized MAPEG superfamily protein
LREKEREREREREREEKLQGERERLKKKKNNIFSANSEFSLCILVHFSIKGFPKATFFKGSGTTIYERQKPRSVQAN